LILIAVAFEAKVLGFVLVWLRDVVIVDSTSTFNGSYDESLAVSKAAYRGGCEFQWGLQKFYWIKLLALDVLLQIPYMNIAFLMCGDEKRPLT
jgi:hypothetical protein